MAGSLRGVNGCHHFNNEHVGTTCEGNRHMQLNMSADSLRDWTFVEGAWSQNGDGVMTAPSELVDRNLAIFTAQAYTDFEARFEFRWDFPWTSAGLVFAGRSALDYFVLNFPVVGQHFRKEHFWGGIGRVDESGFIKTVSNRKRLEQIGGVPSEIGLWHDVRLVVEAGVAQAWVDRRPMAQFADVRLCEPGFVGLLTYASLAKGVKSSFRNLHVQGRAAATTWDDSVRPRRNWSLITDLCGTSTTNIVRAGNADLLFATQVDEHSDQRRSVSFRSSDNGRTWDGPEPMPLVWALNARCDGELVGTYMSHNPPFTFSITTSNDHGKTWSPVDESTELNVPDTARWAQFTGTTVVLDDGTLVWFTVVHDPGRQDEVSAYAGCIRSTDEGRTWSQPIPINGPGPMPEHVMKDKDVNSETCGALTQEGRIVAFVRNSEPTMYECSSDDGGLTWRPAARGPFANYAGMSSMLTTRSGVVLLGGRFPGIGVQVSYDHGYTWQCTETDAATWAQGGMIEVEDDVVLHVYGGPDHPHQIRRQLLHVTPEGLEAVFE